MGKRLNYASFITESREDLEELLKQHRGGIQRDRLRFLLYLKTGESLTQSDAARRVNLSERQGQRNWSSYRQNGLSGLLDIPKGGAPCKLNDSQLEALEERLKEDDIQFLHEAVSHVEQTYGKSYTPAGIHFLFKRLKVKKKPDAPATYNKTKKD